MKNTVCELTFGVDIHLGDKCFVLYRDAQPRTGTLESVSDEKSATVALDDGSKITVEPDRLTLSFKLWYENQRRRGVA